MWIVPKNHQLSFLFAPVTEESREVWQECLEASPSSLMWRSKPSPLRTWLTRWKRDKWIRRLSGRMLKPSDRRSFEDALIFLRGDTPVSPSPLPESDGGKMTQDICGPTSDPLSIDAGQNGFFSKMLRDILQKGSYKSSPIWKDWRTGLSAAYSQRLKSAHRTNGSASLSWPTASSRDWKDTPGMAQDALDKSGKSRNRIDQLARSVYHYGPPGPEKPNSTGKRLVSWPTTSAGSSNGGQGVGLTGGSGNRNKLKHLVPEGRDMMDPKKLNPDWVEQLMGLPIGLTDLDSSGTE